MYRLDAAQRNAHEIACPDCGATTDWEEEGNDVFCSCQRCPECGEVPGWHKPDCSEVPDFTWSPNGPEA